MGIQAKVFKTETPFGTKKPAKTLHPAQLPHFNLVRWFSFLSLVSIVIISSLSAISLTRFLTENMLRRDAVVAMEIINGIVKVQKAKSYFINGVGEKPTRELEEFFAHVAHLPDVLRANVYAADRTILWSSNEQLLGKRFDDNPELEEAFLGELNTEVKIASPGEKEEHVTFANPKTTFIENYLPIWSDDGETVIGVVELYRSPRALIDAINAGKRMIWSGALASGAFLFAVLFWIVYRGNSLILKAQKQLIETDRLATVGELASAVAHGLRNPLASIRSSAELALDDDINSQTRSQLQAIVSQSDRLESWIRGFLTQVKFSGIDQDTLRLDLVLRDCLDGFEDQAKVRHVNISVEHCPNLPTVRGNRAALSQVFNSVISNSIEAMPAGGRITIRSAQDARTSMVYVAFEDTGIGLPSGKMGLAFEQFGTTKDTGLGVGLPIAQRIVERLGGRIELTSREGQGTTATVWLPSSK